MDKNEIVVNSYGKLEYTKSDDIISDSKFIIETARTQAYQAVNVALVGRNWLLGKRIAEEELNGDGRAEYGSNIIKKLSSALSSEYGKGFDYSSLYKFVKFYKAFPSILDSVSTKSSPLLSCIKTSTRENLTREVKGECMGSSLIPYKSCVLAIKSTFDFKRFKGLKFQRKLAHRQAIGDVD